MARIALSVSDSEQRAGIWLTQNGNAMLPHDDLLRCVVYQFFVAVLG